MSPLNDLTSVSGTSFRLSKSLISRFYCLRHGVDDVHAYPDQSISDFYGLGERVDGVLASLDLYISEFYVFVNELTTYERPGALIDVVHETLCHL